MSRVKAIFLSGAIWLAIGFSLLYKGLFLLAAVVENGLASASMRVLAPFTGSVEQAALLLVAVALFVGFLKGRIVLKKSVNRNVARTLSLEEPIKIKKLYSKGYLFLIGGMMCLGFLMRMLPDIGLRAFIDVAVGSALMNGALLFIRQGLLAKRELKDRKNHL